MGAVLYGEKTIAAESSWITPQEVAVFRSEHEAGWKAKIGNGGTRLFFRESDWPAVLEKVRSIDGPCKQWRILATQTADSLIKQPIPAYLPPESFIGPETSVTQAEEELWQRPVGANIMFLSFMAKLDGNPKYTEYLHDLVLAALRFDTWGHGKWKDNDLAAANIVRGVAVAFDWQRDIFTENEQVFIKNTMARRVPALINGLYGKIFWGNQYRSNHNQICCAAMGLAGLAFLEEIPAAGDWLSAALLDYPRIASSMNADGSSEEGVGYWSYGMNSILLFIEGTRTITDSSLLYKAPFLKNAARYRLACSTPGFNGTLMWGDSTGNDFYGPQQILYRLASEYRDESAQYLSDHLPFIPRGSVGSSDVLITTLLWYNSAIKGSAPAQMDSLIGDWGVIISRSGWKNTDYLFSLKAGINNANHSHLDAGAIAFNFGGTWLLTSPGYGDHGGPGFWDREGKRWTYFTNATESHCTLLVNGTNQRFAADAGGVVKSMISTPDAMMAEVDLTQAYDGVKSVIRRVYHRRGEYILVLDDCEAPDAVKVEWLAQVPPLAVVKEGVIDVKSGSGESLRIEMLGAPASFKERSPNSPWFNLSPGKLKTLAASAEGKQVRFISLLQPFFAGKPHQTWHATVEKSAEKIIIRMLCGSDTDIIEYIPGPKNIGNLGNSQTGGIGNFISVRNGDNRLTSIIMTSAVEMHCPRLSFHFLKPVNASVTSGEDGTCNIDLDNDIEGTIQTDSEYMLQGEDAQYIPNGKKVYFLKGRYFLRTPHQTAGK